MNHPSTREGPACEPGLGLRQAGFVEGTRAATDGRLLIVGFFPERGRDGVASAGTAEHIVYTWHATSHVESEDGILTVYTGGEPAARLSALPDEERISLAVGEIEKVFPGSAEWIEHTATIAWPNEEFTRGSYMALAPGQVTGHWKTLLEPAGRLFFAGEHATAFQGFMEGALESCQRAAAIILSHRAESRCFSCSQSKRM